MVNFAKNNKSIIERELEKIITEMCRTLGLSRSEWDVDIALYKAVTEQSRKTGIESLAKKYDDVYRISTEMSVRINPKYTWLKNIYKKK